MKKRFPTVRGRNLTTEEFIYRANIIHGNKFLYNDTVYINYKDSIKINCPIHGDFWQSPREHLSGCGCKKCGADKYRTWTIEELNILEENYSQKGARYCFEKIKTKTLQAVRIMAQRLGLERKFASYNTIIPSRIWSAITKRVRDDNFDFNLTPTYLEKLFLDQNSKCALTGWDIVFHKEYDTNTASLDRIDSAKGYLQGNVQWVHKDVNFCKQVFSEKYFYDICDAVSKNRKEDFSWSKIEWVENEWLETVLPVRVKDTEMPMKNNITENDLF